MTILNWKLSNQAVWAAKVTKLNLPNEAHNQLPLLDSTFPQVEIPKRKK